MDKMQWIKELVLAEQEMEESGVIDVTAGFDPEQHMKEATIDFMFDLKEAFVEAAAAFNQMKGSSLGTIKIYGISKTESDFMLFRNGFKLIFSMQSAGLIRIRFHTLGAQFLPSDQPRPEESADAGETLKASWGAFGELNWTYNEKKINLDYLVRHYMTKFIRESAK